MIDITRHPGTSRGLQGDDGHHGRDVPSPLVTSSQRFSAIHRVPDAEFTLVRSKTELEAALEAPGLAKFVRMSVRSDVIVLDPNDLPHTAANTTVDCQGATIVVEDYVDVVTSDVVSAALYNCQLFGSDFNRMLRGSPKAVATVYNTLVVLNCESEDVATLGLQTVDAPVHYTDFTSFYNSATIRYINSSITCADPKTVDKWLHSPCPSASGGLSDGMKVAIWVSCIAIVGGIALIAIIWLPRHFPRLIAPLRPLIPGATTCSKSRKKAPSLNAGDSQCSTTFLALGRDTRACIDARSGNRHASSSLDPSQSIDPTFSMSVMDPSTLLEHRHVCDSPCYDAATSHHVTASPVHQTTLPPSSQEALDRWQDCAECMPQEAHLATSITEDRSIRSTASSAVLPGFSAPSRLHAPVAISATASSYEHKLEGPAWQMCSLSTPSIGDPSPPQSDGGDFLQGPDLLFSGELQRLHDLHMHGTKETSSAIYEEFHALDQSSSVLLSSVPLPGDVDSGLSRVRTRPQGTSGGVSRGTSDLLNDGLLNEGLEVVLTEHLMSMNSVAKSVLRSTVHEGDLTKGVFPCASSDHHTDAADAPRLRHVNVSLVEVEGGRASRESADTAWRSVQEACSAVTDDLRAGGGTAWVDNCQLRASLDTQNSSSTCRAQQSAACVSRLDVWQAAGGLAAPNGGLHIWRLLSVLRQIAAGMRFLHRHYGVHGDLRPRNVLLEAAVSDVAPRDSEGDARAERARESSLIGSALDDCRCSAKVRLRHVRGQSGGPHRQGGGSGCEVYVAPEVHGGGALTPSADIFAFGVIMWEAYNLQSACAIVQAVPDAGGGSGPCRSSRHHQDFSKYPPSTPLQYGLLTIACISPSEYERPTFDRVEVILAELEQELRTGTYTDMCSMTQSTSRLAFKYDRGVLVDTGYDAYSTTGTSGLLGLSSAF